MQELLQAAKRRLKSAVPALGSLQRVWKRMRLRKMAQGERRHGEPELAIVPLFSAGGSVFVDVGANLGIYSWVGAAHFGAVFAVEPVPQMCQWLRDVLPANAKVLEIAASDSEGVAELFIPEKDGMPIYTRSSLQVDANAGLRQRSLEIATRTLDRLDLGSHRVALVKIDVEGNEMRSLRGSVGIIERDRPAFIIESERRHNPSSPQDVFEFMWSKGYAGYFIHDRQLKDLRDFRLDLHQNADNAKQVGSDRQGVYINNFIFIDKANNSLPDAIRQLVSGD